MAIRTGSEALQKKEKSLLFPLGLYTLSLLGRCRGQHLHVAKTIPTPMDDVIIVKTAVTAEAGEEV